MNFEKNIYIIRQDMYRSFFKLFQRSLPLLALPIALKTQHCFWGQSKKQNLIKDRVFIDVEVSNKPCEDRSASKQLQSIGAYSVAVYDGHGGWQVSHLCSKILLDRLDARLAKNKPIIRNQEELIITSLKEAFMDVENQFLEVARNGYKLGFGRMARAGSCALVCVVCNNKVYTANAGDSLGLIIEKDSSNRMGYIALNRELNANNAEERERLKKLFPKQEDIVICKRQNTACYVKGRLQPTRSLGDLRLKHAEFNNPQSLTTDHDYQSQLKTFTGPYITWEPEITTFELNKNYKALILASDGLWDELEKQQVAELFKNSKVKEMPKLLIDRAMEKAAQDASETVENLRKIPAGKKRKLHDDITVVVVDLEGQFKEGKK